MIPRIPVLLLAAMVVACGDPSAPNPPATPAATSRTVSAPAASPRVASAPTAPAEEAARPVPAAPAAGASPAPVAPPSAPTVDEARQVLEGMRALAAAGNPSTLVPYIPKRDRGFLHRPATEIQAALSGKVLDGQVQGGRVVLTLEIPPAPGDKAPIVQAPSNPARGKGAATAKSPPPAPLPVRFAVMLRRAIGYRYDPVASERWAPPDPGAPDPSNRDVPLAETVSDLPGKGRLVAVIDTSEGRLECGLFPEKAPRAVATFVGLARGRRAFQDPATKTWDRRPFYDGQLVTRARPGIFFSFGCADRVACAGPGFSIPDEPDLSLRHDLPGRLGIDNLGRPNQGAARVYITAAPDPDRDDRATIFGQCGPLETIQRITQAADRESRPQDSVIIRQVTIRREESPTP